MELIESFKLLKVERKGEVLLPFAIQHLKTSYPEIIKKMNLFRNKSKKYFNEDKIIMKQLRKKDPLGEHIHGYISETPLPTKWDKKSNSLIKISHDKVFNKEDFIKIDKLKTLSDIRTNSYFELKNSFHLIRLKIAQGSPLLGNCELCPDVQIASEDKNIEQAQTSPKEPSEPYNSSVSSRYRNK